MNRSNSVHYLTLFQKQIHCPVIPFVGFMLHNLFVIAMSPALHGPRLRFQGSSRLPLYQDTPLRLVRQVVDFDIRPCPVRNRTTMEQQKKHEFGRRKTWKITQKEAWRDFQWVASEKQLLVGGFSSVEKYESNWIISPSRGENKKSWKPPPRLAWQTTIGFISVLSSQDVLLMTSRMVEPALPILDEREGVL